MHRLIRNDYQFTLSDRAKANMENAVADGNNLVHFMKSQGYFRFKADAGASSRDLYVGNEPSEFPEINQAALKQVVDVDSLENRRDCEVNGLDAVTGELDGLTYLCWTISPTHSCVLEYTAESISEADIFCIAQSVGENSVK